MATYDEMKLRAALFRSGVVSAVFSLFKSRKRQAAQRGGKYLLQDVAEAAGVNKSQASRWFSGDADVNWKLSTLFDIAEAMDGEVRIEVVDRLTGEVHTPSGKSHQPSTIVSISPPSMTVTWIGTNVIATPGQGRIAPEVRTPFGQDHRRRPFADTAVGHFALVEA